MSVLDTFTFHPDTAKYDAVNAYWLGKCAALAYADPAEVAAATASWGLDRSRFLDKRHTQCFVAGNTAMIVVAFRGTQPNVLRDWVTDAGTRFVPGPFGRVHEGFQQGLRRLWDDMVQTLVEFQDQAQSLWFTGHSLGAALATLAVAHLRAPPNDKPVYGLYTFGQPRVGDREFEQRFNVDMKPRAFRFVNNNDLVTRVPGRVAGFSHVGTFLYFDHQGKLHDDLSRWYRFLDRLQGSAEHLGKLGPDQLLDHSMVEGYLANLARNVDVDPFAR